MTIQKADFLEQTARILAGALGMLLWVIAMCVHVADPLVFLVGSGLVLFALNGTRLISFSLGKDGVKMESRLENVVARSNPTNTPEVVTLEAMPSDLRKEANNITASINTDGMGTVRIVRPFPDIAIGIGKTLTASGITDYSPESIVGIGVFGADSESQSSVLILGENGRTLKINYGLPKGGISPSPN